MRMLWMCCGDCARGCSAEVEERRLSSGERAVVVERKNASPRPTSFGSADKGDEGKEGQGQGQGKATRLLSHTPSSTPSPWVSHDKMLASPQQTILLSWWNYVNCSSHAKHLSTDRHSHLHKAAFTWKYSSTYIRDRRDPRSGRLAWAEHYYSESISPNLQHCSVNPSFPSLSARVLAA